MLGTPKMNRSNIFGEENLIIWVKLEKFSRNARDKKVPMFFRNVQGSETEKSQFKHIEELEAKKIPKQITGWWYTYPSEKYESVGMVIPNIWKNKKCSKPPTR